MSDDENHNTGKKEQNKGRQENESSTTVVEAISILQTSLKDRRM
jgi:hypothetical protein